MKNRGWTLFTISLPASSSPLWNCSLSLSMWWLVCGSPEDIMVKNLPAVQERWVLYLGWEDPLEESMATRSSNLACESPWKEDPGGLYSMGLKESGMMSKLHTLTHHECRPWTAILFVVVVYSISYVQLISFSRASSWPKDGTHEFFVSRQVLYY